MTFVPGVELCGTFYGEVLAPQLAGVPHAAALLGWGSDVLGYDTARSTDYGWGPRVLVFADAPAPRLELRALRDRLGWYPDPVWRWLLACQWRRLAQEEAFVARTVEVGDALGARVLAGRQVREMMRLVLLQQRRYAPYSKWLGTAFARCAHDDDLPELLARAIGADQDALGAAYLALAARHDAGGLTEPVGAVLGDYHDRPARVIMADRFATALLATVDDPRLRALPLIGSVDQVVDCTDVLEAPTGYRRLAALYRG